MIRFNSDPIQLESRLGRVGSIQSFDLWQFRESREACVEGVAQIASLSYGNEAAKNPQALFDRIVSLGHLSCLEFVPMPDLFIGTEHLPSASLRHNEIDGCRQFGKYDMKDMEMQGNGATGFLVEAPIFVARQWMRHRSFSYLEMSRRYVKGSKVPLEFYGEEGEYDIAKMVCGAAVGAYERLIEIGQPPELARRVLPVGLMTKFYVGGFDRDWCEFVRLRSDAHAQPEIRVFADEIAKVIA